MIFLSTLFSSLSTLYRFRLIFNLSMIILPKILSFLVTFLVLFSVVLKFKILFIGDLLKILVDIIVFLFSFNVLAKNRSNINKRSIINNF